MKKYPDHKYRQGVFSTDTGILMPYPPMQAVIVVYPHLLVDVRSIMPTNWRCRLGICLELSNRSQSFFTQYFKKETGMTPSQYQKKYGR